MHSLKELKEKFNEKADEMSALVEKAEKEDRDFTEEESKKFEQLKKDRASLEQRINRLEEMKKGQKFGIPNEPEPSGHTETKEEKELHEFAHMIRENLNGNRYQVVGDGPIKKGDNGNIIPTTIMNRIIDYVKDRSPIFKMVTRFNAKGTIQIPKITKENNGLKMAYQDEFSELTSGNLKFEMVELKSFLAGTFTLLSKSLVNNTDVDLMSIVVAKIGDAVADFYEHEVLIGTKDKALGLSAIPTDKQTNVASADKITIDDLIDLQDVLPSTYQSGAIWIMNKKTKTVIRKLKDKNNRFYFLDDPHNGFSGSLLGNLVYTTDVMPKPASAKAGDPLVFFVNPKEAVNTKMVEEFELQPLLEAYATKHAIGLVGWTEFDTELVNEQAAAVMKMAASA